MLSTIEQGKEKINFFYLTPFLAQTLHAKSNNKFTTPGDIIIMLKGMNGKRKRRLGKAMQVYI